MSKKFEVGDKVRIKASVTDGELDGIDYPYQRVGRDGVYAVRSNAGLATDDWVRLNNDWYVRPSMIELVVEEKRKFEVGDKVRVKTYQGTKWHGLVGQVTESDGHPTLIVRFEDGPAGYRSGGFDDYDLAPVAPSPKFNVGDRVKVVGTSHGNEGTIVALLDQYDTRPFLVMFDDCWLRRYDENEMANPRTWSKPDASQSIALDVIDTLVDEMTTALRAHGGDCETRRFGDVMVVVENGQAKIYRLEASSNVG